MDQQQASIEEVGAKIDQITRLITRYHAWRGPPSGTASLSAGWIPGDTRYRPGDLIHLNGLTVQVIAYDRFSWTYQVRLPTRAWRLHAAQAAWRRRLGWVDSRLLLTCQIWGLLPYDHGRAARWRDLRPVRAMSDRWRKFYGQD